MIRPNQKVFTPKYPTDEWGQLLVHQKDHIGLIESYYYDKKKTEKLVTQEHLLFGRRILYTFCVNESLFQRSFYVDPYPIQIKLQL